MLTAIRQKHPTIPIGLLMYANLVFSPGIDEFYAACERAGVDSVMSLPMSPWKSPRRSARPLRHNIAPIFICPPNADDDLKAARSPLTVAVIPTCCRGRRDQCVNRVRAAAISHVVKGGPPEYHAAAAAGLWHLGAGAGDRRD
jgi:tryptophan synthase alpha subunit